MGSIAARAWTSLLLIRRGFLPHPLLLFPFFLFVFPVDFYSPQQVCCKVESSIPPAGLSRVVLCVFKQLLQPAGRLKFTRILPRTTLTPDSPSLCPHTPPRRLCLRWQGRRCTARIYASRLIRKKSSICLMAKSSGQCTSARARKGWVGWFSMLVVMLTTRRVSMLGTYCDKRGRILIRCLLCIRHSKQEGEEEEEEEK